MMMNIDDVENFPFSLRSCSQELDVLLKKYKLERASSNVSIPHCFLDGFVKQFRWPYGPIRVHYRTKNVGMQAQWIENWFPSSLDEFAFVVEDDVVVSIHWYQYIKRALSVYYYGKDGERFRQGRERIIGISTQRPQLSLGRDEKARVNLF